MIIKPETIADQKLYKQLTMEHSKLIPLIQKFQEFEKVKNEINDAKELINSEKDQEMKELLKTEISSLEEKIKSYRK